MSGRRAAGDCARIEPLLSAFVDGELPAAEAASVDAHVARCRSCQRTTASLAHMATLLSNLPVRQMPTSVAARFAGPLLARARRSARVGVAAVAIATTLGAATLGAAFALGGHPEGVEGRTVQVPVDVFVSDHLVQSRVDTAPTTGATDR